MILTTNLCCQIPIKAVVDEPAPAADTWSRDVRLPNSAALLHFRLQCGTNFRRIFSLNVHVLSLPNPGNHSGILFSIELKRIIYLCGMRQARNFPIHFYCSSHTLFVKYNNSILCLMFQGEDCEQLKYPTPTP